MDTSALIIWREVTSPRALPDKYENASYVKSKYDSHASVQVHLCRRTTRLPLPNAIRSVIRVDLGSSPERMRASCQGHFA